MEETILSESIKKLRRYMVQKICLFEEDAAILKDINEDPEKMLSWCFTTNGTIRGKSWIT